MSTTQPAASAGAEKLVSLIRPMIAEAQAQQTNVLREFIKAELNARNADLNESLADIQLSMNALKVRFGAIEKELQESKKKGAITEDPIKLQLDEIGKKLTWVHSAVVRLKPNMGSMDEPDRVQGLPPNVLMKETGPAKNMFSREDDELDIDCD